VVVTNSVIGRDELSVMDQTEDVTLPDALGIPRAVPPGYPQAG
jgi:hypothetical protein